jgi:hypothetical protein
MNSELPKDLVLVADGFVDGTLRVGLELGARVRAFIQTQIVREPAAEALLTHVPRVSYATSGEPDYERILSGVLAERLGGDPGLPKGREQVATGLRAGRGA